MLALVPADDHFLRGGAAELLGLAYWTNGDLEAAYRSSAAGMAALQCARNIADAVGGALALADEAARLYVSDLYPNVRPVAAWKVRVWIAQGHRGDALGWAREQGLPAEDDLSYLREFEHLTLARVLLARSQSERAHRWVPQARALLERLLATAEAGERTGSVLEILVLQALAGQGQGAVPVALGLL